MTTWDLWLLQKVNREWTHPFLDWLLPAVSAVEAWYPLFALAVLLVLVFQRWKGVRLCLMIAVALGVSDGLISNTLKDIVGRVRPRSAMAGLLVRDLGPAEPGYWRLFVPPVARDSFNRGEKSGNSFPSSHTMNLFALATVVALHHRRWGWVLYAVAALVAYSRLYCAAHWPSDLPPSAAMGVLVGLGIVWAIRLLFARLGWKK
jgi:undecaprenyl-diphosphatase